LVQADEQSAERIGKDFYNACRDVGFVYLINTGFPQEMVDRMFEMSKAFFALPQEPHPIHLAGTSIGRSSFNAR
jgi:isopenicillin N synthase-like dioxygenase